MSFRLAIVPLIAVLALAGCAGANVGLRAGDSSLMRSSAPPPGTSYSSAAIRVEASPNAYIGVLFLGSVTLGTRDEYQRWRRGAYWRKPPDMAEGRKIEERDCSQPLGYVEANLRCK
jgi:hypothetical protein